MHNYVEKFRSLAKELNTNENIVLKEYKEYSGVTSDVLDDIESKLGFKLPLAVKAFYLQVNGLRLSWTHKKDDSVYSEDDFDEDELDEDGFHDDEMKLPENLNDLTLDELTNFEPDSSQESGSISIKSIQKVFLEAFPMNEELVTEGFYVFDAFSAICGAAISFPKSKEEAMISFNCDYYTHFSDYETAMTFDKYLDFLIKTKGIKYFRSKQNKAHLLDNRLINWPNEYYFNED